MSSSQSPDFQKRKLIRAAISADKTHEKSDRDFAKEFNCSKGLVGSVRRQMIAAGEYPADQPHKNARSGAYAPGQSARGGYVYDELGKVIRVAEWEARLKMNSKKTAPAPVLPQVPAHQEDLNFAELGKYLSVSRETARRLCFDGKIPYRKLSTRCYRVSRADAEHYKQSATHHAT